MLLNFKIHAQTNITLWNNLLSIRGFLTVLVILLISFRFNLDADSLFISNNQLLAVFLVKTFPSIVVDFLDPWCFPISE